MRRAKKRRAGKHMSSAVNPKPRVSRLNGSVPRKAPARKSVTRTVAVASRRRNAAKPLQHARIARIRGAMQDLRQIPGVAQAQVQSLTGDRVQRLRGVADEGRALADALAAHAQRERHAAARARRDERARAPAESLRQRGEERVFRHVAKLPRPFRARAPDHAIVSVQRQQRERAVGREALPGGAGCAAGAVVTSATTASWP